MAKDSFQNEIPKSRVNIRYVKDTGGAMEEVELPQRIMVVGDFTLRESDEDISEMKKTEIDKNNFDAVMGKMNIRFTANVPDRLSGNEGDERAVNFAIKGMEDFSPEKIVENVPELAALAQVRALLNDLKSRVINNKQFRLELEKILKDQGLSAELAEKLQTVTGAGETR